LLWSICSSSCCSFLVGKTKSSVSGSRSPRCCFHLAISVLLHIFYFCLVSTAHTWPAPRTDISCRWFHFRAREQRPIFSSHSGAVPARDFVQVSCAPKIRLLRSIFHRRVVSVSAVVVLRSWVASPSCCKIITFEFFDCVWIVAG
jgi:hypothetical protein